MGVTLLSHNNVVSFLVHDCSSKCIVEEGGGKSEDFFLAKNEALFEIVKSFALFLVFSCKFFLGNVSSCFRNYFEK